MAKPRSFNREFKDISSYSYNYIEIYVAAKKFMKNLFSCVAGLPVFLLLLQPRTPHRFCLFAPHSNFAKPAAVTPARLSALYAANIRHKVCPDAVGGIFRSMVRLSDHGDLLAMFIDLPLPKPFMYGEEYARLSYLSQLALNCVERAEIPYSGHFPMYSNAQETWRRISDFLEKHDPLSRYDKLPSEQLAS